MIDASYPAVDAVGPCRSSVARIRNHQRNIASPTANRRITAPMPSILPVLRHTVEDDLNSQQLWRGGLRCEVENSCRARD